MAQLDPVKTTIRLTAADQANIDRITKTGIATNTSEAIRVALVVAPQFLSLWQALMNAKVENITESLVQLQEDLARERTQQVSVDELRRAAKGYEIPAWLEPYVEGHARAMGNLTTSPSTGRRR